MKKSKLKILFSTVALAALALSAPLQAQAGKVEASDPKFDELQSPNVGGNTGKKNWKPKDWLEAEVKFKVEMPKSYKAKTVDSVTVKWYVAIKNPAGKGVLLLEKDVEHVNIPVGEEVYSSVYISPAAGSKISGKARFSKRNIEAIGGEILVNGSSIDKNKERYFSQGQKIGWWKSGSLSRYDRISLLNKNETPFKFLWWDRYAEIKTERR